MAIIICPHCGKYTSDNETTCANCGKEILAEYYSADDGAQEAAVDSITSSDGSSQAVDYLAAFNSTPCTAKKRKDKMAKLFVINDKLEWVFLIALIGIMIFLKYNDIPFFRSYGGAACILFILFLAITVSIILKHAKEYIIPFQYSVACAEWLNENKINALPYIREEFDKNITNFKINKLAELFDFARGVLFASEPKYIKSMRKHATFNLVLVSVFCLWVSFAMPFLLPEALYNTFNQNNLTLLLIAVVPFAALLLARIVFYFACTKRDINLVTNQYLKK